MLRVIKRASLSVGVYMTLLVLSVPALAQDAPSQNPANGIKWEDVFNNIRDNMPEGLGLITGIMLVIGVMFVGGGLMKANAIGTHRSAHVMGGAQNSWSGPSISIVTGVALIFISAIIFVTKTTGFGASVNSNTIRGFEQLSMHVPAPEHHRTFSTDLPVEVCQELQQQPHCTINVVVRSSETIIELS